MTNALFQRCDSAMHLAAFEGFTETLEVLFSPEMGANKFAKNEVSITSARMRLSMHDGGTILSANRPVL